MISNCYHKILHLKRTKNQARLVAGYSSKNIKKSNQKWNRAHVKAYNSFSIRDLPLKLFTVAIILRSLVQHNHVCDSCAILHQVIFISIYLYHTKVSYFCNYIWSWKVIIDTIRKRKWLLLKWLLLFGQKHCIIKLFSCEKLHWQSLADPFQLYVKSKIN